MSLEWTEPESWTALGQNEAHVWLMHLPSARADWQRITEVLSAEEVERASKFRFEPLRERAQLTRGILRLLLARYLGVPAREITFTQNSHGKPAVERPTGSKVFFNLSHSGDYAVLAVTQAGETGVDIEQLRDDMTRLEEIAHRFYAKGERKALSALPLPARARAFFELWTRKEAFVKARGDGLFSGLDQFEVSLVEPRLLSIDGSGAAAANWWMTALPPVAGYTGAMVVNAALCSPRFWNWNSRWIA